LNRIANKPPLNRFYAKKEELHLFTANVRQKARKRLYWPCLNARRGSCHALMLNNEEKANKVTQKIS